MLRAISVENFRGFERFEMSGLGRVNLLVGTNNCGKTSVLEAIWLFAERRNPEILWMILERRGERTFGEIEPPRERAVDVRHLFRGRSFGPESELKIRVESTSGVETLRLVGRKEPVEEVGFGHLESSKARLRNSSLEREPSRWLNLVTEWQGQPELVFRVPFSSQGIVYRPVKEAFAPDDIDVRRVRFVPTESLPPQEVVQLLESIMLTPEEETLLDALRSIEPDIERIAPLGSSMGSADAYQRDGAVIRVKGSPERVPIGSMGDGIWRILGITMSLLRVPGGILLVDEIDTGLHYSVMARMWKLVLATAKRLNVQVFATSHSRDCYESLAAISRADVGEGGDVSIQRIEKGKAKAVAFTEQEIVIASERGIEVR